MLPTLFGSRMRMSCLCFVMAAFFCLVFNAGCGPEGSGGDTGTTGTTGSSGGTVVTAGNSNALKISNLNKVIDESDQVWYLGEVENTGSDIAYLISIQMRFLDAESIEIGSNGAIPYTHRILLDTHYGYCHYSLAPGEVGVFAINSRLADGDIYKTEVTKTCSLGELGSELETPDGKIVVKDSSALPIGTSVVFRKDIDSSPAMELDRTWPVYAVEAEFKAEGNSRVYNTAAFVVFSYDKELIWITGGGIYDLGYAEPGETFTGFASSGVSYDEYNSKMTYEIYMHWEMKNTSLRKTAPPPTEAQYDRTGTLVHYAKEDKWFIINDQGWEEEYNIHER